MNTSKHEQRYLPLLVHFRCTIHISTIQANECVCSVFVCYMCISLKAAYTIGECVQTLAKSYDAHSQGPHVTNRTCAIMFIKVSSKYPSTFVHLPPDLANTNECICWCLAKYICQVCTRLCSSSGLAKAVPILSYYARAAYVILGIV